MLKDWTILEQTPSAGKKNCKEMTKYQGHCLKKIVMKRLGIIIYSYQEHIKHQKAYRNNRSTKQKKQIQIIKTTKKEKHSWKQYMFQAKL